MPTTHAIIGAKDKGKTTTLIKVHEMILRVYDNYEVDIIKIPINTKGDFIGEIYIRLGQTQKDHIKKLQDCSSLIKNKKKEDNVVKILFQTAGDQQDNFNILNRKIDENSNYLNQFDLIFFCLRTNDICQDKIDDISKLDAEGKKNLDTLKDLLNSAIIHNCIFNLNKELDQLPIKLLSIVDQEVKKLY